MKYKVGYFIKKYNQTIENTVYFNEIAEEENDPAFYEWIVEEAAHYIWEKDNDQNWFKTGEVLTLVIDGKEIADYEIGIDNPIEFYAEKVN